MAGPIPSPYPPPAAQKTTPAQICRWALMSLGQLGATQPLDGDDLITSFEMLNGMIDAWKLNELLLEYVTRAETRLKAGQAAYTIGPGGDFTAADASFGLELPIAFPPMIYYGSLLIDGKIERPLGAPRDLRNLPAGLKYDQFSSDFPDRFFYVPSHHSAWLQLPPGCGFIWVYPTPDNDRHRMWVWYPKMLDTFTEPLAEYYLRPGMVRALRTNLAMELAPLFQADPSNELRKQAKAAYDWLQVIGAKPNELRLDPSLVWPDGRYNLYADNWNLSR